MAKSLEKIRQQTKRLRGGEKRNFETDIPFLFSFVSSRIVKMSVKNIINIKNINNYALLIKRFI